MKPKMRPLISTDHQDHYKYLLERTDWTLRGNGNAILSARQVIEIRTRYMAGETARDLGAHFGVDKKIITNVVRGVSWKQLPLPEAWVGWVNEKIAKLERIR